MRKYIVLFIATCCLCGCETNTDQIKPEPSIGDMTLTEQWNATQEWIQNNSTFDRADAMNQLIKWGGIAVDAQMLCKEDKLYLSEYAEVAGNRGRHDDELFIFYADGTCWSSCKRNSFNGNGNTSTYLLYRWEYDPDTATITTWEDGKNDLTTTTRILAMSDKALVLEGNLCGYGNVVVRGEGGTEYGPNVGFGLMMKMLPDAARTIEWKMSAEQYYVQQQANNRWAELRANIDSYGDFDRSAIMERLFDTGIIYSREIYDCKNGRPYGPNGNMLGPDIVGGDSRKIKFLSDGTCRFYYSDLSTETLGERLYHEHTWEYDALSATIYIHNQSSGVRMPYKILYANEQEVLIDALSESYGPAYEGESIGYICYGNYEIFDRMIMQAMPQDEQEYWEDAVEFNEHIE